MSKSRAVKVFERKLARVCASIDADANISPIGSLNAVEEMTHAAGVGGAMNPSRTPLKRTIRFSKRRRALARNFWFQYHAGRAAFDLKARCPTPPRWSGVW